MFQVRDVLVLAEAMVENLAEENEVVRALTERPQRARLALFS